MLHGTISVSMGKQVGEDGLSSQLEHLTTTANCGKRYYSLIYSVMLAAVFLLHLGRKWV